MDENDIPLFGNLEISKDNLKYIKHRGFLDLLSKSEIKNGKILTKDFNFENNENSKTKENIKIHETFYVSEDLNNPNLFLENVNIKDEDILKYRDLIKKAFFDLKNINHSNEISLIDLQYPTKCIKELFLFDEIGYEDTIPNCNEYLEKTLFLEIKYIDKFEDYLIYYCSFSSGCLLISILFKKINSTNMIQYKGFLFTDIFIYNYENKPLDNSNV